MFLIGAFGAASKGPPRKFEIKAKDLNSIIPLISSDTTSVKLVYIGPTQVRFLDHKTGVSLLRYHDVPVSSPPIRANQTDANSHHLPKTDAKNCEGKINGKLKKGNNKGESVIVSGIDFSWCVDMREEVTKERTWCGLRVSINWRKWDGEKKEDLYSLIRGTVNLSFCLVRSRLYWLCYTMTANLHPPQFVFHTAVVISGWLRRESSRGGGGNWF